MSENRIVIRCDHPAASLRSLALSLSVIGVEVGFYGDKLKLEPG